MEDINAKSLRAKGWTIIFRDENVIAQKGENYTKALRMPVTDEKGMHWEQHASLSPHNWQQFYLDDNQQLELRAVKRLCYCASLPDGSCDFCTGLRREEVKHEMTPPLARPPEGSVYPVVLPLWNTDDILTRNIVQNPKTAGGCGCRCRPRYAVEPDPNSDGITAVKVCPEQCDV